MATKMQRSKGGTQGRGVKMKPALPAAKSLPQKSPAHKPFTGRVFYLDITSKLLAEKLENDIKELGGTVEGFLSKEISYLITNKKEAKCSKSLKYTSPMPSPEPARNSGNAAARPSGRRGERQAGGAKKPEKDDVSRGKSLLKKVIKEPGILPKNSILANALNWGVRILHVEEAKMYIEQKKRSLKQVKNPESSAKPVVKRPVRRKARAQKLKNPFIKVEDSSGQYRPLYLVLPLFRSFQSPVCKQPCQSVDKKAVVPTETKPSLNKAFHGQDGGNNSHVIVREPKKRGFCECCLQKYEDLEAHVISPQHKNYSQGPHYQDVDNLVSSFDFDFVDWSKYRQEVKSCGILMPPGTIKQETFPPINHISQKMSFDNKLESELVPGTELKAPPAATCLLVSYSQPMCSNSCPLQLVCNPTCVTDYSCKPPSAQVLTPSNEAGVYPTPADETGDMLLVYNKDICQKDMPALENNTERLTEQEPSPPATTIQNCLSEPVIGCPGKKIKLEDSLDLPPSCSKTLESDRVTETPPTGKTEHNENLGETCPSKLSDALPQQSPPCSLSSKLHRKVKESGRKARKREELHSNPTCKISVPMEPWELSLSKERLVSLFESSSVQSEFHGFSCNSVDSLCHMEDKEQPSSHGNVLWSLFSHTDSSASTFNGF